MKILLIQDYYSQGNIEVNLAKISTRLKYAQEQQVDLVLLPVGAILGLETSIFADKLIADSQKQLAIALQTLAAMEGKINILLGNYSKTEDGKINSTVYHYDPQLRIWELLTSQNPYIQLGGYVISVVAEVANKTEKPHIVLDFNPQSYTQRIYQNNDKAYTQEFIHYIQLQPLGTVGSAVYPGGSTVYRLGKLVFQAPITEEKIWIYDIKASYPIGESIFLPIKYPQLQLSQRNLELLFQVLCFGLRDFLAKIGHTQVIIGLSGGMDSALCLALAIKALGAERVHTAYLPSPFSSQASTIDTQELVRLCGVKHLVLPITKLYQCALTSLEEPFANQSFSVAEENIQSRLRAILLMALANKFNYILLNNSNKSELCMGYGTLYGDLCGGVAVLGDLYKTQVYSLAKYINQHIEPLIPESVFTKAPSAELRPNQKDSDSLPEYAELDPILFALIEQEQNLAELQAKGIDPNLLQFIWQRLQNNKYKMHQICPILELSSKTLVRDY